MGKNSIIAIKMREREISVPAGKPVLIRWNGKDNERKGVCVGIGWIKRGERPHSVEIIHRTFSTIDKVDREYSCRWIIYETQILEIKILKSI